MSKRQELFNQAAENWDKEYDNLKLRAFLDQFVPSFGLLAGQSVLDVGTGTGILIPFLHQAVGSKGHITAVDYAQNMVNICKTKHADLPNVSIIVANAEDLQVPVASFDAVTCFAVFPHLEHKKIALKQFHHVLKSKGKLIIAHALSSTQIKAHHSNIAAVAQDVLPQEQEMKHLLKEAGFTNITVVDKPGCYLCISDKPST